MRAEPETLDLRVPPRGEVRVDGADVARRAIPRRGEHVQRIREVGPGAIDDAEEMQAAGSGIRQAAAPVGARRGLDPLAMVPFAAAMVLVVVGEMEDVDHVAPRIHARHVAGDPLAGPSGQVRQQRHLGRRIVESHRVAAVDEHRRAVREDVEHRLAAARVDEMDLVVPRLPPRGQLAVPAHAT